MWLEDTWTTGIMTARWALTLVWLKDGSTRSCGRDLPQEGTHHPARLVTGPSLTVSQPWEGLSEPRHPSGLNLGVLWGAGSLLLWVGHRNGVSHRGQQQRAGLVPMARWKTWCFYHPFYKVISGWQVQNVTQGSWWYAAPPRSSLPASFPRVWLV